MAFAGFDRDEYPGDAVMQTLINTTNLTWCGYYLYPAPSHDEAGDIDPSWMGKRAFLKGLGWGLAPVYVGEQTVPPGSLNPSAAKGTIDGNDAVNLMSGEGFPAGSYVYLDIENPAPLPQIMQDYAKAWCAAVTAGDYKPGIYINHHMAAQAQALQPNARIWAVFVTTTDSHVVPGPPFPDDAPSGSGFAGAFMWQCQIAGKITIPGEATVLDPIDFDTALSADPSV